MLKGLRSWLSGFVISALLLSVWGVTLGMLQSGVVYAHPSFQDIQPTPPVEATTPGKEPNANCLMCHSNPDFKGSVQNGDLISLYVPSGEYQQSVHGRAGLECVACHISINRYPHHEQQQISCLECHDQNRGKPNSFATLRVQLLYTDKRSMTLKINEACRTCHVKEFEVAGDSAHVKVLNSGNTEAPICVDCHGSHDLSDPANPRPKISHSCAKCHLSVYSSYRSSVHGAALEAESNPDVPTCINCHGVHSVRGPRDPYFRNDSIAICGSCHSDKRLMAKYGISTAVFDTYLNDFHGRTVDLFRRQEAGISSNKAVCFDCHGIHNIRRPEDPLSSVYPANLQHTCQQCHKDANIRFPQAWLSHFLPTLKDTPVLFGVNLFYQALISLTIGSLIFYIILDTRKRWLDKRQVVRQALAEEKLDEYDFTQEQ